MLVSLWIFSVDLPAQENDKREKNKRERYSEANKASKSQQSKDRLDEIRRQLLLDRKRRPSRIKGFPQKGRNINPPPHEKATIPGSKEKDKRIDGMEPIPIDKDKHPDQIKKTPDNIIDKKNSPGEVKKHPVNKKTQKKIPDEIISISKLDNAVKEFSINRDIFSPELMRPVGPGRMQREIIQPPPPPKEDRVLPQVDPTADSEEEIQGMAYEGYVIKDSKNCALLSMNGEFHAVTIGDIILDKIKIIEIDKKTIKVEVDSHEFEIQIKEDEENEIQ
jgi:hypothetical protein